MPEAVVAAVPVAAAAAAAAAIGADVKVIQTPLSIFFMENH
jgi:hypothetical protein